jgi:predicted nuclease with RNAse H fold
VNSLVVVGIEVASKRPCTCVVLQNGAVQEWLDTRDLDQMASWVRYHRPAVIAVDAPCGLSKELLLEPESGEKPCHGRTCDYELRQRGIPLYEVPREGTPADDWMEVGFRIYDRLQDLGYQLPREAGVAHSVIEVYPEASFITLLGGTPAKKWGAVGRAQRLATLKRNGLSWRDRFDHDALDALAAALTAMRFLEGQASAVGDAEEALVWLPVAQLQDSYSNLLARAPRRRRAELDHLDSRLSPEKNDELLQHLLVAARRGGDAMIEVLERTLLPHTGEEVFEERGGTV